MNSRWAKLRSQNSGPLIHPLRPSVAPVADGSLWAAAQTVYHGQDAAGYAAWVEKLSVVGLNDGVLTLMAPSRFHARYVTTTLQERLLVQQRACGERHAICSWRHAASAAEAWTSAVRV